MAFAIGVDVGGTFTDVVLRDSCGAVSVAKCLSTHYDPIAGIVTGVTRVLAGRDPAQVTRVVHATTLATNAVLERTGARVAYVTTEGFRDVVPLGRYARVEEDRYDLRFTPPPPPVAPEDCFEVTERVSARGEVLTPLDDGSVRRVAAEIARRGIGSAAVCLLHSYANPAHERRVAEILRASVPAVVTSSEVWPEIREYERATTTIMSAYIGPLMASYLSQLRERLAALGVRAPVHVMESGGGVISAELAARRAVATIESGPAAGVLAAAGAGFAEAISFDMGGTTAKACVVRGGRPEITHEFHVGGKGSFGGRRAGTGVPIKTPAIDLAEVGAGGGSVAWLDAAGALRVGPRSAGSSPGPACYGLGGAEPTVTDANLVLGYLSSASIPLRPGPAAEALDRLAGPLGVSREAAAYAVHEIVSAAMASAVHVVTVQRGIDPRGFALVAFGGAGPMHAARVAGRFGIATVVVPAHCGVASAAGLLAGELSTDRVRSRLEAGDPEPVFAELTAEAAADLGVSPGDPAVRVERSVDVRFRGQSHDLTVAWSPSREVLADRFAERYRQVYGIAQRGEIEPVGYRVRVTVTNGTTAPAPRSTAAEGPATPGPRSPVPPPAGAGGRRAAYFAERGGYVEVPVHTRATMPDLLPGPAIIEDAESTIVVPPSWTAALVRRSGAVHLTAGGPA
ncbi:hydantoinase/oxoprolinase family protein [Actinomadura sp. ATCC 31491]|uniref:Hydantoinase/oxoprolinase family protein n=1 Tax=Actinomadura luzonensis TaxID=2805427 RepID=A0ABT0G7F1_9ACTN|nr:hydantoinase/oxoprolinase family protein [Actinomadura luzonensis]MCK2220526.1 hydantoinase/oxoprolinase family protein [Actinomadura luzonensis]